MDIIGEVQAVLHYASNIGYLGGDCDALEGASQGWYGHQNALTALADELDRAVRSNLTGGRGGNWNDPAGDAFQKFWQQTRQDVTDLASKYGQMGKALHDVSGEVKNFNDSTTSVIVELLVWVAITVGMSWIPFADVGEEVVAGVRAAWLVERFWSLLRVFILFLNGVRKAFAINLVVFYVSRAVERAILNPVNDPTKGWSKYDGQQMLWGSLIGSAIGSAFALPGTIARVGALSRLGAGLRTGAIDEGSTVAADSATAKLLQQGGFNLSKLGVAGGGLMVPTRGAVLKLLSKEWVTSGMAARIGAMKVPSGLAGRIWYSRLPLIGRIPFSTRGAQLFDASIQRPLLSLTAGNALNLFNRAVIQGFGKPYWTVILTGTVSTALPAGLVTIGGLGAGLFGKTLPTMATLPVVVGTNGVLEVLFPQVREARGLHFDSHITEVTGMDPAGFLLTPRGPVPVGTLPIHGVVSGDNLWNIARREYGNGADWQVIAKANHLHGTLIRPGQLLWLPPLPAAR
jgi:uncharacterized protein YukE